MQVVPTARLPDMQRSSLWESSLRIARAGPVALSLVALIHIHIQLHHDLHGPPFDYVGLALAAAASWIGIPGPGEPVLIAAGVLAASISWTSSGWSLVAWVAATAGGVIGWLIGMRAGRPLLTAPGPLHGLRVRTVARGDAYSSAHPVIAIMSPRLGSPASIA